MGLLQDYITLKNEVEERMDKKTGHNSLLLLQELKYRIMVMSTLKDFMDYVPNIEEAKAVKYHTRALFAYIKAIPDDHTFAPKAKDEALEKRETALKTLRSVCEDACENLIEYEPEAQELYGKELGVILKPFINVWAQYRETLIPTVRAVQEEELSHPPKKSKKMEHVETAKKVEEAEIEETSKVVEPVEKEEKPKEVRTRKPKSGVPKDLIEQAKGMKSPIKQYTGMTIWDVYERDKKAIRYLATVYEGRTEVKELAVKLHEYAEKQKAA